MDKWVNPKDDAEYAYVPAGTFMMGSADEEVDYALKLCGVGFEGSRDGDEQPIQNVSMDAFRIMRTEMTSAQCACCMAIPSPGMSAASSQCNATR